MAMPQTTAEIQSRIATLTNFVELLDSLNPPNKTPRNTRTAINKLFPSATDFCYDVNIYPSDAFTALLVGSHYQESVDISINACERAIARYEAHLLTLSTSPIVNAVP